MVEGGTALLDHQHAELARGRERLAAYRRAACQAHSATHLIHAALRDVLGPARFDSAVRLASHEATDPTIDSQIVSLAASGADVALAYTRRTTLAERMRATPAPWEVALRTDTPRLVPTLVITGDDRPMYTEVAAALEAAHGR